MDPLGLYISVPFCRAKCSFCNFASDAFAPGRLPLYVSRLCQEIRGSRNRASQINANLPRQVDTLYFGGGTPSLLQPPDVREIFTTLRDHFDLAPDAEITVECAPNQLSPETLEELQRQESTASPSASRASSTGNPPPSAAPTPPPSCVPSSTASAPPASSTSRSTSSPASPTRPKPPGAAPSRQAIATGVPHISVYMLEVDDESRLGREILSAGTRYGAPLVPTDDASASLLRDRLRSARVRRHRPVRDLELRPPRLPLRPQPQVLGPQTLPRPRSRRPLHAPDPLRLQLRRRPLRQHRRSRRLPRKPRPTRPQRPAAGKTSTSFPLLPRPNRPPTTSPATRPSKRPSSSASAKSKASPSTSFAATSASPRRPPPTRPHRARRGRPRSPPTASLSASHPAAASSRTRSSNASSSPSPPKPQRQPKQATTQPRSRITVPIDLRSDTVTQPTPAMRQAMASAEVGDDVYSEDPTVNRLEAWPPRSSSAKPPSSSPPEPWATRSPSASTPSTARRSSARPAPTSSTGRWPWSPPSPAACPAPSPPPAASSPGSSSSPLSPRTSTTARHTALICLENTHNMAGGTVTPLPILEEIWAGARHAGLPTHLDGARVFNAAAALNLPVAELTRGFDTVMFCLSKGLGAPVGSMLVGSAAAHQARPASTARPSAEACARPASSPPPASSPSRRCPPASRRPQQRTPSRRGRRPKRGRRRSISGPSRPTSSSSRFGPEAGAPAFVAELKDAGRSRQRHQPRLRPLRHPPRPLAPGV